MRECEAWFSRQFLRDVLLWSEVTPADRYGLFRKVNAQQEKWLSGAAEGTPELTNAVASLRLLSDIPETVDAASVASACQEIWQWAEMNNLRETALQFAEAAAHVDPQSSSRCFTAGRLCRIAAEHAEGCDVVPESGTTRATRRTPLRDRLRKRAPRLGNPSMIAGTSPMRKHTSGEREELLSGWGAICWPRRPTTTCSFSTWIGSGSGRHGPGRQGDHFLSGKASGGYLPLAFDIRLSLAAAGGFLDGDIPVRTCTPLDHGPIGSCRGSLFSCSRRGGEP